MTFKKTVCRFLALLFLTVLLTGCSPKLTVDTENRTISDGKYTYTYEDSTKVQDGETRRTIMITYPNEVWFYAYHTRYADGTDSLTTQYTNGYNDTRYTPGLELVGALDPELIPEEEKLSDYFVTDGKGEMGEKRDYEFMPGPFFAGLFLFVSGLLMYLRPYDFWWMEHGWAYKNAEPSDLAISRLMTGGICLMVAGVIAVIVSFFG